MKSFLFIFFGSCLALCSSGAFGQSDSTLKHYNTREVFTFLNRPLENGLTRIEKDDKFGIIDSVGTVLVPPIYDEINIDFSLTWYLGINTSINDLYLGQLRFLNEYFYDYWGMGYESETEYARLLKIEQENPESYLNLTDKFRSNPIFAVEKDKKWGVVNKTNETLIPFNYQSLKQVGYDIFLAEKEGKYGILNRENEALVPVICDTIILMFIHPHSVVDTRAYGLLKADGKYGLINLFTKQVLLPKYDGLDECRAYPEDYCGCLFPDKWKNYRYGTFWKYEEIHRFGYVSIFKTANKYGLLNMSTMEEITTQLYDSITFKSGSKDMVCLNEKMTFITDSITLHTDLYDEVGRIAPYRSDIFKIKQNGRYGAFDKSGMRLLDTKWDDIEGYRQLSKQLEFEFIVRKNGKYVIVNNDNKTVLPVRYDSITTGPNDYRPTYYITYKNGKEKRVETN